MLRSTTELIQDFTKMQWNSKNWCKLKYKNFWSLTTRYSNNSYITVCVLKQTITNSLNFFLTVHTLIRRFRLGNIPGLASAMGVDLCNNYTHLASFQIMCWILTRFVLVPKLIFKFKRILDCSVWNNLDSN